MKKDWEFDEEVCKDFDNHIRSSIPGYNDMLKTSIEFCEWFLIKGKNVYDLGSSTGFFLKELKEKYEHRMVDKYIGIDEKTEMKSPFYNNNDVLFENKDLTEINSFDKPCVITSFFTMQFLQKSKADRLNEVVYQSLEKGGLYLIAEKFSSKNSYISEIKKSLLLEFKVNNGISEKDILEKDRLLRGVMKLNDIEDIKRDLKSLGYKECETLYVNNNFCLHACIK